MNLSASSCDTINVFALKDCKMRRKTPVSAVIILSANVRGKCYALHDMWVAVTHGMARPQVAGGGKASNMEG